jgi:branched-chain amino acid aminotransferase
MSGGLKTRLQKVKAKPLNQMRVWSNGTISSKKTPIDSLNFVLHYGAPAVWEGIRSYLQEDGSTKIWLLSQHIKRLFNSAKILNIKIPYTEEQLVEACQDLVESAGGGDLYLRPIAYTTQDAESVRAQTSDINVDIYAFPLKSLDRDAGIKARISSVARGYPQYQMQAKTTANYAVLHNCKHEFEGVDEVLFCDNDGYIVEASVANIFIVKNNIVYTPPQTGSILSGLTRQYVAEKLRQNGVEVFERRLTRADVYTADEFFMTGTYVEVVPITQVDGRTIGEGTPGKVTRNAIYNLRLDARGVKRNG